MTSKEIKELMATDLSTNAWLRELAFQLALMNEKGITEAAPEMSVLSAEIIKRGPGRPRMTTNANRS